MCRRRLFSASAGLCRPTRPWTRSYEILQTVPGREREIRIALKKLDTGLVEIKSRGVTINTDALQRRLRGKGDRPLVVIWTRMGDKQKAFIGVRRKNDQK